MGELDTVFIAINKIIRLCDGIGTFSDLTTKAIQICRCDWEPGATLALIHPVHTADCKTAFSSQNLITTAMGNRLSAEHIHQLNIEGKPLGGFNFMSALNQWRSSKKRAIFNQRK